jgi:hypothetical protein
VRWPGRRRSSRKRPATIGSRQHSGRRHQAARLKPAMVRTSTAVHGAKARRACSQHGSYVHGRQPEWRRTMQGTGARPCMVRTEATGLWQHLRQLLIIFVCVYNTHTYFIFFKKLIFEFDRTHSMYMCTLSLHDI